MVDATERVTAIPPVAPPRWDAPTTMVGDAPSSIAPAETKERFVPSKPVLSSPTYGVLEGNLRRERVLDRWQLLRGEEIEDESKKMEAWHRKEVAKITEAKEVEKEISFWGMLEDVGNSMMGVLTLGLGASALAAGSGAVGGALLVSGTCSIGNLAFKHMGVWDYIGDQIGGQDEELRSTIKTYAPTAVGVTAAAMGVYGSASGWQYAAQTGMAGITSLLQAVGNVATTLTTYSRETSTSVIKHLQADLTSLQTYFKLSQQAVQACASELMKFHEREMHTHEALARLIEATNQTIQQTQQPV